MSDFCEERTYFSCWSSPVLLFPTWLIYIRKLYWPLGLTTNELNVDSLRCNTDGTWHCTGILISKFYWSIEDLQFWSYLLLSFYFSNYCVLCVGWDYLTQWDMRNSRSGWDIGPLISLRHLKCWYINKNSWGVGGQKTSPTKLLSVNPLETQQFYYQQVTSSLKKQ